MIIDIVAFRIAMCCYPAVHRVTATIRAAGKPSLLQRLVNKRPLTNSTAPNRQSGFFSIFCHSAYTP